MWYGERFITECAVRISVENASSMNMMTTDAVPSSLGYVSRLHLIDVKTNKYEFVLIILHIIRMHSNICLYRKCMYII